MQGLQIDMIPVASSNIKSAGYDPPSQTLRITFKSGETFDYHFVPAMIAEGFMAAESKGKYFHKSIRDRFRSERVA